jgi:hypothetical protein
MKMRAVVVIAIALAMVLGESTGVARTPDEILTDYARAVGGEANWARHKTMHIKRQLTAKGMQLGGTEDRYARSDGKLLSVTSFRGMGNFRQGSTGRVRWSEDPINGLRILQGAEDEEARIETTWNADLKIKKLFSKVRTVAPPVPPKPGESYECLELSYKLARPMTVCFDTKTGLRVLQKGIHATPQGDVPYTARVGQWKDVGGVKVPFWEELTAGPMTIEADTLDVVFNEPMADSMFDLPKTAGVEKDKAPGRRKGKDKARAPSRGAEAKD